MTVFGGEETAWGTRIGGFFVTCTKCSWHSQVEVVIDSDDYEDSAEYYTLFKCHHCGNEVRVS